MKRDRWDSSSDEEDSNKTGHDAIQKGVAAVNSDKNEQKSIVLVSTVESSSKNREGNGRDEVRVSLTLPKHNPLLQGCRSVYDCYERIARLDEGTYGIVWKARDTATSEVVALKQIKFDSEMVKEGFPVTALREINVLLALSHECIVTVREMVVGDSNDKVFMVMEVS